MRRSARRGKPISHKMYCKDHPRPVMNPDLTPWIPQQRERRRMRRDKRARKRSNEGESHDG